MPEQKPTLEYAVPRKRDDQGPMPQPDWSVGGAVCLLLFPAVPFVGIALQIGIVFTLGGLATLVTFICAIIGLLANFRSPSAGVWAVSAGVNGLAFCFFYWWIFVHGLC